MKGPQITALQSRSAQCSCGNSSGRQDSAICVPAASNNSSEHIAGQDAHASGSCGSDSTRATCVRRKPRGSVKETFPHAELANASEAPAGRGNAGQPAASAGGPVPAAGSSHRGYSRATGKACSKAGTYQQYTSQRLPRAPAVAAPCRTSPTSSPATAVLRMRLTAPKLSLLAGASAADATRGDSTSFRPANHWRRPCAAALSWI
mmetsp:Transcript_51835/g.147757  ORF Transcript_51835/g.147757 Transcript_51835/m.147757 type:complete len:205 (+) Transcript_51835:524-1138(+)